MAARSEPMLWVQLIGAGVLPLEGLLLLLVLAGSDPGPVPGLERLLCWALGALAPTLLLWHRPADVWSLLVLQTPMRARRPLQQRLSRLQDNLGLRVGMALAGASCLPLLWWLDEHAAVASSLSPLQGSPRLVVLLLAALLLALMLWQWQQLLQALWLLTRSSETVAAAKPMPQAELEEQRLCLGLPLLLLDPLQLEPQPAGVASGAGLDSQVRPEPLTPPPAQAGDLTTTAEATAEAMAGSTAAPSAESHAVEAQQQVQPDLQPLASSEAEAPAAAGIATPPAADHPLSLSAVESVMTERQDLMPDPVEGRSPGPDRDAAGGDREQTADASAGPCDGADAPETEAPQA